MGLVSKLAENAPISSLNWRRESSASPDRGEPLGVVDVLISSETTKHRLPQPTDERKAAVLSCGLMCTLPGTPVIRYGDEIGMGDNLDLPERNCARTPMQWSTEPRGGFTKSERPCSPVIDKGPYGYEHINVAKQRRDPTQC